MKQTYADVMKNCLRLHEGLWHLLIRVLDPRRKIWQRKASDQRPHGKRILHSQSRSLQGILTSRLLTYAVPILQHHRLPCCFDSDQALNSATVQTHLHPQGFEKTYLHCHGHMRSYWNYCCLDSHLYLCAGQCLLEYGLEAFCEVCQSGRVSLLKHVVSRCSLTNHDSMYHANAALNITTDLLVAALPVRQLWKLQIAMRQKIALLIILTLGWLYVYFLENSS